MFQGRSKAEVVGIILGGLISLALFTFGAIKFIQPGDYAEQAAAAGMNAQHLTILGILLFLCAITYTLPKTRIIGAILTTGYFGGAIAVHLLGNDPVSNMALPIALPVVAWLAIYLRNESFKALVKPC